jgi:hypothetical protein
MITLDEVARIALALPEVTEGTSFGHRAWFVGGKHFAWARPFSKADVKRFGDDPVPTGEILAVMLDDLGERDAVLAAQPDAFLTIPHFHGYPAVLIRLEVVSRSALVEAVEDGWLATAPQTLVEQYRTA